MSIAVNTFLHDTNVALSFVFAEIVSLLNKEDILIVVSWLELSQVIALKPDNVCRINWC